MKPQSESWYFPWKVTDDIKYCFVYIMYCTQYLSKSRTRKYLKWKPQTIFIPTHIHVSVHVNCYNTVYLFHRGCVTVLLSWILFCCCLVFIQLLLLVDGQVILQQEWSLPRRQVLYMTAIHHQFSLYQSWEFGVTSDNVLEQISLYSRHLLMCQCSDFVRRRYIMISPEYGRVQNLTFFIFFLFFFYQRLTL